MARLVLFGASGHIGRRVLQEALSRGHHVTGVQRRDAADAARERLTTVRGDVLDAATIAPIVAGHDAVISAVGPQPGESPRAVVDAAHALVAGLTQARVRRLLVVGGAGSLEVAPGVPLLETPQFPAAWRAIAAAHRDALAVYQSSDLDWTFVSPPALIEPGRRTGRYRTGGDRLLANGAGESRISTEDYAVALLDEVDVRSSVRRRMTVADASDVTCHLPAIRYRKVRVRELEIFYREAGPADAPTMLLLHGFPASSHMFRRLISALADQYHVVAPDYPGFGYSSMPAVDEFEYSFANLAAVIDDFTTAIGLSRYTLFMQDYGAPVGFRLALRHPKRVDGLVIQNGNAYQEGIDHDGFAPIKAFWKNRTPETSAAMAQMLNAAITQWQYTHGARAIDAINPDTWRHDQVGLDRPGNRDVQLALFYDYRHNVAEYPKWQQYLRDEQPPTLIVWGARDPFFPVAGAHAYQRDLPDVELHLLETGHFALEEDVDRIAVLMRRFASTIQVRSVAVTV